MDEHRLETFYVFEHFKAAEFSLSKVAALAFKALSKHPLTYNSHSTRVCPYEESVLAITKFEVKFEDDPESLEVLSDKVLVNLINLTELVDLAELVELVDHPEKLECGIFLPKQLTCYSGTTKPLDLPLGCISASVDGKQYEFEHASSSLSETLYTAKDMERKGECRGFGKDTAGYVRLKATFEGPNWIKHSSGCHIVYPGLEVSECVRIQLFSKVLSDRPSLAITCVSTELLELSSTPVPLSEAKKTLNVVKLLRQTCFVECGNLAYFNVPVKLLKGCIPQVGPSFYSSSKTQTYAIKVSVELKDLHDGLELFLERLVDVDVAQADYHALKRLFVAKNPASYIKKVPRQRRMFMEVFDRSLFDLKIGSMAFHILDRCKGVIEMQQTSLVHGKDHVVAVTFITCINGNIDEVFPSKAFYALHKDKIYRDSRCYMKQQQLKVSKEGISYKWISPVISYNEGTISADIPRSLWSLLRCEEPPIITKDLINYWGNYSSMRVEFLYLSLLKLPLGEEGLLVTEEMSLDDLIKLRMVWPYKVKESEAARSISFKVDSEDQTWYAYDSYRNSTSILKESDCGNFWYRDVIFEEELPKVVLNMKACFSSNFVGKSSSLDLNLERDKYSSDILLQLVLAGKGIDLTGENVVPPEDADVSEKECDYRKLVGTETINGFQDEDSGVIKQKLDEFSIEKHCVG